MAVEVATAATSRRQAVIEGAARLLAEEGPSSLSVRRMAELGGGSTQMIYTLFGGKQGVADALYAEGFRRLGDAMVVALHAAGPLGDPVRLVALAHAYRDFALSERSFFAVMFGPAIPDFVPAPSTRDAGKAATFGQVVTEVQACLDAGALDVGPADDVAKRCWASIHGLAALEVAGMLDDVNPALVEQMLRRSLLAPVVADGCEQKLG